MTGTKRDRLPDKTVPVWRDNRIDREESYKLSELAFQFGETEFGQDEYRDHWPLTRCVGAWLSGWAVMDEEDQRDLVRFIAEHPEF